MTYSTEIIYNATNGHVKETTENTQHKTEHTVDSREESLCSR